MSKQEKNIHPLKLWRLGKKLTQAQASIIFGVSRITFQRFENGDRIPDRETMPKIAHVTGLTANDFYPPASSHQIGARAGP